MSHRLSRHPLALAIAVGALATPFSAMAEDVTSEQVVTHYADLAHTVYTDALKTASTLDSSIDALLASPTPETLAAARKAWRDARVAYQQSEVFRFGNPIVDDWEGQLNAWPLDEGLIDYVASDNYQHELGNAGATANIIASTSINVGGEDVDVSDITPELLASLNEIGGSEANVATGYHAIEFLLWGQDLHGYEPGAGERAATDFVVGEDCTNQHCDRRRDYIAAASDLLVEDLEWMVDQWAPIAEENYRSELLALPAEEGLRRMLFGMGSLSLGELAGERMKVALEANSWEDEHDCFSDNTHNSHFYNGLGIQNVYTGHYQRSDGSNFDGPSLEALLSQQDADLAAKLDHELDASMAALSDLKARAEDDESPMTFDMMIAPDNAEGAELVDNAILALVTQTASIEQAAGALGVNSLQSDDAGHTF